MKKSNKNKEKEIARLKHENKQLKDEVQDLLTRVAGKLGIKNMDTTEKEEYADKLNKDSNYNIENLSHLVEELKTDVISRSLMITKKVADA